MIVVYVSRESTVSIRRRQNSVFGIVLETDLQHEKGDDCKGFVFLASRYTHTHIHTHTMERVVVKINGIIMQSGSHPPPRLQLHFCYGGS